MSLDCSSLKFSGHAVSRMFERGIRKEDVVQAVNDGEVIQRYPDDRPYPSCLLLWNTSDLVIHVVTVYKPSLTLWESDYRNRKKRWNA
ncbi:DUF4258 domain-containing protein [Thiolapillus sp.]|uniref:DUF4258 domain-containing protein n=2 Tax=Thiolapillus sp. TaxID=2017437 RepID=UPI0025CFD1CD|nr:DUF4258 domain-containing protein [Thiolapillus sp.]